MKSWSWLDRILLGMAILFALGCGVLVARPVVSSVWNIASWFINTNQPDPRMVALLHLPRAYQLAYPGAALASVLGRSRQAGGESGTHYPATVGKSFGVLGPVPAEVSSQTILDWYAQQVQVQGWTAASGGTDSI